MADKCGLRAEKDGEKILTTYCGIILQLLWDICVEVDHRQSVLLFLELKSCTVNEGAGLIGIHRCFC